MKVECELCHATAEAKEIVPRASGMDIRCGACDQWFAVAARASGPAAPASTAALAVATPALAGSAAVLATVPAPVTEGAAGLVPMPTAVGLVPATSPGGPVSSSGASGPYRTLAPGPGCPKCGRARANGQEACPRCGLVFELWRGDPVPASALDERGEILWSEIERIWTDKPRHEAFLQHCVSSGLLSGAGRRYRERLDRDPADQVALEMQKRVVGMATQLLGPPGTPVKPVTQTRAFAAVVVLSAIGGLVGGLLYLGH